jgi:hypothetical protein
MLSESLWNRLLFPFLIFTHCIPSVKFWRNLLILKKTTTIKPNNKYENRRIFFDRGEWG